MKKHMFLILSAYLVWCGELYAQSDSCFVDSTINKTFAQIADSVFKHTDLSQVPTGYLIEKAFSTLDNIEEFNGSVNDSNVADALIWRRAFGTLHRAAIDSSVSRDTLTLISLADTMQSYSDSGYIPISILNMQYNRIKSYAFENELLHMDGIQIYDVEEREESPYEEQNCFVASSGLLRTDSTNINFIIPQSLYITNDGRDIDHIEINFNDGEGWRTVAFGSIIPVEFPAAEMYKVVMKMVFEDMQERISHFYIEVRNKVYKFGPSPYDSYDEHYFIEADEDYEGVTGSAHVFIHYSCSNTDKKLRRPFIVAGGFGDPMTIGNSYLYNDVITGSEFFDKKIKDEDIDNKIYPKIISQEYDLVFVNFFKPTDYIQSNALVLEKIIKLVNEEKATNGSLAKNVVFGNSMGGLVARYALGDMHTKHLANPSENPDHDTKLYYSHDSPHRGVNAPLGVQAMIKTYYRYFIERNHVSVYEVPSIYWDYQTLMCTSARQMVIDHISPSSLHTDFYNELKTVAPFTNSTGGGGSSFGCKAVLISNGSGDGVLQNNGTVDLHPGNIISQYGYVTGKIFQAFNMYAEPDATSALTSDIVFEAALISMINGQIIYPFYVKAKALTTQYHGLDGMPGSAGPQGAVVGQYTIAAMHNHYYISFPTQCFIPTFSSVAMKEDKDFDYHINSNRGDFEADRFITQDDMASPPPQRNGTHT
ncbi:MAG: hypothetical protein IT247_00110, partial [Bacteroidia bacterium]|nr:hypothetical protein [Bacteroidia bacterium]